MSRINKARPTAPITPERSIESLIEELEQLQIQQAVVLDAIIERTGAGNLTTTVVDVATGFETTATAAPAPAAAPADNNRRSASALHPDTYRVWDNVRINNSVRVNGRVSNSEDDYIGVVEKLTAKYIHVRTKSGRLIRRAPANLSHRQ